MQHTNTLSSNPVSVATRTRPHESDIAATPPPRADAYEAHIPNNTHTIHIHIPQPNAPEETTPMCGKATACIWMSIGISTAAALLGVAGVTLSALVLSGNMAVAIGAISGAFIGTGGSVLASSLQSLHSKNPSLT